MTSPWSRVVQLLVFWGGKFPGDSIPGAVRARRGFIVNGRTSRTLLEPPHLRPFPHTPFCAFYGR